MSALKEVISNLEQQLRSYENENDFRMKMYKDTEQKIIKTKTLLQELKGNL